VVVFQVVDLCLQYPWLASMLLALDVEVVVIILQHQYSPKLDSKRAVCTRLTSSECFTFKYQGSNFQSICGYDVATDDLAILPVRNA
jgi:hypothetical protein